MGFRPQTSSWTATPQDRSRKSMDLYERIATIEWCLANCVNRLGGMDAKLLRSHQDLLASKRFQLVSMRVRTVHRPWMPLRKELVYVFPIFQDFSIQTPMPSIRAIMWFRHISSHYFSAEDHAHVLWSSHWTPRNCLGWTIRDLTASANIAP